MRSVRLVRYVSPFGSPAWMVPDSAEFFLRQDTDRFERFLSIEEATGHTVLSIEQRRIGAPRIEHS